MTRNEERAEIAVAAVAEALDNVNLFSVYCFCRDGRRQIKCNAVAIPMGDWAVTVLLPNDRSEEIAVVRNSENEDQFLSSVWLLARKDGTYLFDYLPEEDEGEHEIIVHDFGDGGIIGRAPTLKGELAPSLHPVILERFRPELLIELVERHRDVPLSPSERLVLLGEASKGDPP